MTATIDETTIETAERPIYAPRVKVPKTGPAIAAALRDAERDDFIAQLRIALAEADETLDVQPAVEVINRWWPKALLRANPEIQEGARRDRERIAAGDPTVFADTTHYPHAARNA